MLKGDVEMLKSDLAEVETITSFYFQVRVQK